MDNSFMNNDWQEIFYLIERILPVYFHSCTRLSFLDLGDTFSFILAKKSSSIHFHHLLLCYSLSFMEMMSFNSLCYFILCILWSLIFYGLLLLFFIISWQVGPIVYSLYIFPFILSWSSNYKGNYQEVITILLSYFSSPSIHFLILRAFIAT